MFPVTDLPILTTGDNNSAVGGFDEMMLESLSPGPWPPSRVKFPLRSCWGPLYVSLSLFVPAISEDRAIKKSCDISCGPAMQPYLRRFPCPVLSKVIFYKLENVFPKKL